MTSQINYTSINANYPVAGQNNNSQGFRDNFTVIKSGLQTAYTEISALQTNSVQIRTSVNLGGNTVLANGVYNGSRITLYNFGSVSGSQTVNFVNGSYQKMTLTGSATIGSITNWPSGSNYVSMRLEVVVNNTGWTLTFPSTVTLNYTSLANINTRTITFTSTGTYIFDISSSDAGTNFSVDDLARNRNLIQGNLTLQTVVSNASVNGITMTVQNIGGVAIGNITATNFIGNIINISSNSGSFTGNVTANNIIANTGIYGNLLTAIQSNITAVGTLTALSVSGNANVGNLTVTGVTDMCGGTGYGLQYVSIGNAGSETIYSNVGLVIVEFTSNISGCSLTMPTAPMNGQAIKIAFGNNTCSTLTHVASGQTLLGARTAGNAVAGGEWVYYTTTNTWYKAT